MVTYADDDVIKRLVTSEVSLCVCVCYKYCVVLTMSQTHLCCRPTIQQQFHDRNLFGFVIEEALDLSRLFTRTYHLWLKLTFYASGSRPFL